MQILVIDGQGGGIGREIITELKARDKSVKITAFGTNPYAAEAMRKAGADVADCDENALAKYTSVADVITGAIGIVMAGGIRGEISSAVASYISSSDATKILVPLNKCGIIVVGVSAATLADNIKEAADRILSLSKAKK